MINFLTDFFVILMAIHLCSFLLLEIKLAVIFYGNSDSKRHCSIIVLVVIVIIIVLVANNTQSQLCLVFLSFCVAYLFVIIHKNDNDVRYPLKMFQVVNIELLHCVASSDVP